MLEDQTLGILQRALSTLAGGFRQLPEFTPEFDLEAIESVMLEVADRMQDNYPYFHPYYAGQMLKPPHPIARLAYMLSLWINPNNHALDGGRASSQLEKDSVSQMAGLFGWHRFLGHLTGGGTMANLEALWIASRLAPGKPVLASELAHYTHRRISELLGVPYHAIACDARGRMDLEALRARLEQGEAAAVVATIGTTGLGSVDPLPALVELRRQYGFRLHADAAYGGYFVLVDNLDADTAEAFEALAKVDSIVVDPHKHGLQPYGCGCILFRDPEVARYYKHDSPVTYFSSSELHLGEISLECSRPGAAAVALWATLRLLPLVPDGAFAVGLAKSRSAALQLYERIRRDPRFRTIVRPELDILVWAPAGGSGEEISERSQLLFEEAAAQDLHLALFRCPAGLLKSTWSDFEPDQDSVLCLRSVLMKPEHADWVEHIWSVLDRVSDRAWALA